jgi:uncharacterized protein
MARPRKIKCVNFEPNVTYFKPRAVPLSKLEEVEITFDELEALRLANIKKLSQEDASTEMKIHQSTFQRTITRAREKITDALVNGKAIKINGGEYQMPNKDGTGPMNRGRGCEFGRGNQNAGPNGICVCLGCKQEKPHIRGQPCNQRKCSKCGKLMTRK